MTHLTGRAVCTNAACVTGAADVSFGDQTKDLITLNLPADSDAVVLMQVPHPFDATGC